MRFLIQLISILFILVNSVAANEFIPDRRVIVENDVDFYGSDLQSIFDTTLSSCKRTCLANDQCQAFTFNTRSNSCFPKSSVSHALPYGGAVSARVIRTSPRILAAAATRADELYFVKKSDFAEARKTAVDLASALNAGGIDANEIWLYGRDLQDRGDYARAHNDYAKALTILDAADLWSAYGETALLIKGKDYSSRQKLKRRALYAAINAYLRSRSDGEKTTALLVLADALERNGQNKSMLRAMRLAESIAPTPRVMEKLDYAIRKYGFRVVEHDVESNMAEPRICVQFSEDLNKTEIDYETYVQLPRSGLSVEAEGNKLCIAGVEHGSRYKITLRAGLPAQSGETLVNPVNLNIYVNDRDPMVSFPGRSYVLPKSADAGIPVDVVNVSELELILRRVSDRNLLRAIQDSYFGRSLSEWEQSTFSNKIAEEIWRGTGQVESVLNQNTTTRLPMGEIINDLPAGIYALQAGVPGADAYENPPAMQWFILSDLGMASMSGTDGIHVFVRGLGDAQPRAGISVTLLSKANAVLAESETDAKGYVNFPYALTRGLNGASPALLVAKQGDTDIAFLSLTDPEFDLSDRGVEGREPAKDIDVFLTTDRGAYRAGETVNITALTRDATAQAIVGLPLTAVLTRPDGVEYSRQTVTADAAVAGGHVYAMPIGPLVPRGTWRLETFADVDAPALASTTFLVEDFLPERIDFDLSLPDLPLHMKNGAVLSADARYLFGAPAGDLPAEGEVKVYAAPNLAAYPGYRFGRYTERFDPKVRILPDNTRTDARGMVKIPMIFPTVENVSQPLEAKFTLRIAEGSGRPVERTLTKPLAPDGQMIGLKPMFDDVVPEGTNAEIQIIGIDENLAQTPMQVKWAVNRVETRYQWYRQYGNWNWELIHTRTRVASGTTMLNGAPMVVSAPVDWGHYEIVVERMGGDYVASSFDFYAGWYAPADVSTTPDTLEVSLDKPAYATGETATLRLVPRYAGKALITVMSNHLIDMKTVDVVQGENLIPLEVTDKWGAGAYVTATVIRPMDQTAGRNPARAVGLSYAPVDPANKKLTAAFLGADESAPRAPLDVALRVNGITAGETAYVTIAAVDVGILNLTRFQSPDAPAYYFGQRKLGMGLRDVYGRLIDGMNGVMGSIRSGGDSAAEAGLQSPPPTEELVAYFSGPVQVGADGIARTTFDLPEFNGTVRLMAVVWSPSGVGTAEKDLLVRDPVVVTASLPRFLAPRDSSRMLLEITHTSGPAGEMTLDIWGQGVAVNTANLPRKFTLGKLQKTTFSVPVTATDIGDQTINVTLTTPDGRELTKSLTVPVRANDPEVSRTYRFALAAGDTFNFDNNVFNEYQSGTGSAVLSIGPLARFDAPGLLATLDRYPYGCTEQTTSRALPLLYLNDVAKAMGLGNRGTLSKRVNQAIERVLSNQSSNGAFGLWRPNSGDMWLDAYVTDFLSRAKSKGFTVPTHAMRSAIDNLRNQVNYAGDFGDEGGADIAYALYVLAREGVAATGDLRYYADEKIDDFNSPMALAQLGAALASYGDQRRADKLFLRASRQMQRRMRVSEATIWRSDYGTNLRDGAAVLALALEAGSTAVNSTDLAKWVANSYAEDAYHSTQESMWSLLAVKGLLNDPSMRGFTANGQPITGPLVRLLEDNGIGATAIRNGTRRDELITMTTFGVPEFDQPATGYGYSITREYLTPDGTPVDPSGHPVGTRLVVLLTVKPTDKVEGRLMVNDPLPAGFEIDNPSLIASGDVKALDWLKPASNVENTEFRSDRFLAAVDWHSDGALQLAYIVRAISPGTYHHPAASVEDMYRPQFRATSDSGTIVVTE